MKNSRYPIQFVFCFAAIFAAAPAMACEEGHASAQDQLVVTKAAPANAATAAAETTRIKISGIHCSSCQKGISAKLQEMDGFQSVKFVSKKVGKDNFYVAEVQHLPGKMSGEAIIKAIGEAGDYKASVIKAQ